MTLAVNTEDEETDIIVTYEEHEVTYCQFQEII